MIGNPTKPTLAPLPIDEALATPAHELLNPFNTILLALELHTGDGDPAARRALATVTHQARFAVRIIDDLRAGSWDRLTLRKEMVELAEVVAGATEATAHLLTARGHLFGTAWLLLTARAIETKYVGCAKPGVKP